MSKFYSFIVFLEIKENYNNFYIVKFLVDFLKYEKLCL